MSELNVSDLLSVADALKILDGADVCPRRVRLPLAEADGLRLATALSADRDYPSFDKSQMDGYAVRRADVSAGTPIELRVVGEIAAGQTPERVVGSGESVAIMTGAPMPPGADGVVPVEDAERIGGGVVRVNRVEGDPARYIARKGSDIKAGELVLPTGTRLGPAQIAAAASVGAAAVEVFAAPRVAVLATGDELVPADQEPGPSRIRNSNSPMLVSLLRRFGCDVTDLGTAPDRPEAIREALQRGLAYDALFVTGGMSMGEYDYVPRLLMEIGVDLKITKLRIKPGKPFVFGIRDDKAPAESGMRVARAGSAGASPSHFVFGLPGNPVSGFVCTVRLASRVLSRLAGGRVEERWLSGKLDTALPANGTREFYQPGIYDFDSATITPLKWKGSADLFTLARANVLLVRTENEPPLSRGDLIRVLEI